MVEKTDICTVYKARAVDAILASTDGFAESYVAFFMGSRLGPLINRF